MNAATTRSVTTFLAVLVILTVTATGQSKKCTSIGGVILTNLGVPDANSTMGYATGDLKGAVGVTILNTESNGNTLVLRVQHHWVSESGDIISLDPATATTTQVAPGLYAIVTYPFHINGNGTGKFAGVSGDGSVLAKSTWRMDDSASATPEPFVPNSQQVTHAEAQDQINCPALPTFCLGLQIRSALCLPQRSHPIPPPSGRKKSLLIAVPATRIAGGSRNGVLY